MGTALTGVIAIAPLTTENRALLLGMPGPGRQFAPVLPGLLCRVVAAHYTQASRRLLVARHQPQMPLYADIAAARVSRVLGMWARCESELARAQSASRARGQLVMKVADVISADPVV